MVQTELQRSLKDYDLSSNIDRARLIAEAIQSQLDSRYDDLRNVPIWGYLYRVRQVKGYALVVGGETRKIEIPYPGGEPIKKRGLTRQIFGRRALNPGEVILEIRAEGTDTIDIGARIIRMI